MDGQNVSGRDLDPQQREPLIRVIAHAALALRSIELERCRRAGPLDLPTAPGARAV